MAKLRKRYIPPQSNPSNVNPFLLDQAQKAEQARRDDQVKEAATKAALATLTQPGIPPAMLLDLARKDPVFGYLLDTVQALEARTSALEAARQ